jgi:DNA ligase (NAD+)
MLDNPEISDFEYDQMLKNLEELEKAHPEFQDSNSPTQRVGSSLNNDFISVQHNYPMYSLENSYTQDELIKWKDRLVKILNTDKISFSCELKLDGVSISLSYQNGNLVRGLTRGDGQKGDDVTKNIRTINTIPLKTLKKIDYDFDIRGEVVIEKTDFEQLNKLRLKNGEEAYMNPRNTASGSIKLVSSKEVRKRPLKCYFFQIISEESPFKSQSESLSLAKELGFNVSNTHKYCKNIDEVFDYINFWDKERKNLNFEIDGIVIKVNNLKMQTELGFTSKFPRWAIAFKFQTEQVSTKLIDVTYQVGRTGAITPVANLSPTLLNGTIVKRASLHNEEQIEKLDLYYDDKVFVEKGGEIIPKIVSVDKKSRDILQKKVKFIQECPYCNTKLKKSNDEAQHYCLNSSTCYPQIVGRFKHFISRKAMDIDGFGSETIERLLDKNIIKNFDDIYKIELSQLVDLDRMAQKSAENLINAINDSKKQPFNKVLFSLGIRYVGETVSKKLANHFKSIDELINASYDEILNVDEIGEKIAMSLKEYFGMSSNIRLIEKLKNHQLNFYQNENDKSGNSLKNLSFVVTGTFENISRDKLKEIIINNGGKVTSSVSSKSQIIAGNSPGPSKMAKADKLGLKPLNFEEFISLYKIEI